MLQSIMKIREYSLPPGWYPRDKEEISSFLSDYLTENNSFQAAIAPHAGWFYSGRIAAISVSGLERSAETVVVLGGHLGGGMPVLYAMEDAVQTPFGPMPIDTQLRSLLLEETGGKEDRYRDNTIEVLLPMVKFFFPYAKLIWLRLPAEISSFKAGKIIAKTADSLNRKINVLASTDLTHYGSNYGFNSHGSGRNALQWVKEVNDRNFITAVESGKPEEVLARSELDQSSCSAGAVLGAIGFAQAASLPKARLLEYATSADVHSEGGVPDSFVGYASFAFC